MSIPIVVITDYHINYEGVIFDDIDVSESHQNSATIFASHFLFLFDFIILI